MKIRCLLVDDEPLALDALATLIGKIPGLDIAGRCKDAVEALEVLHQEDIDLLFLDIQMPELSGLEMLKSLSRPPSVIFTTAYREYAVEAFELDVVDYLVKPVSLERVMKAVNRFRDRMKTRVERDTSGNLEKQGVIRIYSDKKTHKINSREILCVEGLKDYALVHTDQGRLITRQTMKNLEEVLRPFGFLRVHRSWIVSGSRLSSWTNHSVSIGGREIPIGKTYRRTVFDALEKLSGN